MSRYSRAADLARQLVDERRRNMPNRVQDISKQVLRTPRPGGLVAAGQAMRNIARSDAVGMGAGALLAGGGAMLLSQSRNKLGRICQSAD